MEFNVLLNQISELEQINREEEQKFLKEAAAHSYTKTQLQEALDKQEKMKLRETKLLEELSISETKYKAETKLVSQLKETISNLKQDQSLIKQHSEAEIFQTKKRRDEYLHLMEKYSKEFAVIVQDSPNNILIQQTVTSPPMLNSLEQEDAKTQLLEKEKENQVLTAKLNEFLKHEKDLEQYINELEKKLEQCATFIKDYSCSYCGSAISVTKS